METNFKFCPKCGTKLPIDAQFCNSCGSKIMSGIMSEPSCDKKANKVILDNQKNNKIENAPRSEEKKEENTIFSKIWGCLSSIISAIIVIYIISNLTGSKETYNGNIEHDAEIFYEKIYDDYEDPEEVMIDYAVKYGYGMSQASKVLEEVGTVWHKKNQ